VSKYDPPRTNSGQDLLTWLEDLLEQPDLERAAVLVIQAENEAVMGVVGGGFIFDDEPGDGYGSTM
jgi:hypothetical protein